MPHTPRTSSRTAGATQPNRPPSHRRSGSAWPTRPSACSRGYTRSSSRGQTRIRGPTTKVHAYTCISRVANLIIELLFGSGHVGLDFLVLARGARSVRADLLRARTCRPSCQFPQDDRPGRPILLPYGPRPVPQSVRPLLMSSSVYLMSMTGGE